MAKAKKKTPAAKKRPVKAKVRPKTKVVAKRKAAPSRSGKAGAPDANLLADLMKWARAAGADSADALFDVNESISVAQRMGKREKLENLGYEHFRSRQ